MEHVKKTVQHPLTRSVGCCFYCEGFHTSSTSCEWILFSGASHGDELPYIFRPTIVTLPSLPPTSPEVITRSRMISFIANFVKYGCVYQRKSRKFALTVKKHCAVLFFCSSVTLKRRNIRKKSTK